MSEFTSTREGFQRAMEWSLIQDPANKTGDDADLYAKSTSTPAFYHIMNGQRTEMEAFINGIKEWRAKIDDYKPIVHEFLRDGDQLAARMTGTIKVDSVNTTFESFMFAKVDKESGKMEYLIERSVWGRAGEAPEHGTT
ncbi:putative mitochondrial substrate carrier protein [Seiridium cardinale]|uniref:Mitochondrial substrate carrier protein n=1 Tax=Seiridium cardinale TaxID=138064 RepID=A0ABR2Y2J8_9PEZI